ncbi:MAG: hypothetical protein R3F46_06065 [bacterium]
MPPSSSPAVLRRRISICALLLFGIWLAGGLALLLEPRPRIERLETIGSAFGEDSIMSSLDCGNGAALLDSEFRLHCFASHDGAHSIWEPGSNYDWNYAAWPGHGFFGASLAGELVLIDPSGRQVWQRNLIDDAGLEEVPFLILPMAGNDGRMYLLCSGGQCHAYTANAALAESFFVHDEMDLAGPLLLRSDGALYFTDKAGELWKCPGPDNEGQRGPVEALHPLLQQGEVQEIWEARSGRLAMEQDGSDRRISTAPLAYIVASDHQGQRLSMDGDELRDVGLLSGGRLVRQLELLPAGNLVVVSEINGLNRLFLDPQAPRIGKEYCDLRRPLGPFEMRAGSGGRSLLLRADLYECTAIMQLVRDLARSYPALDWLAQRNGGGLLVHDFSMRRDHLFGMPPGSRLLSWPDAEGYFLLLEPGPAGSRVRRCRLSFAGGRD